MCIRTLARAHTRPPSFEVRHAKCTLANNEPSCLRARASVPSLQERERTREKETERRVLRFFLFLPSPPSPSQLLFFSFRQAIRSFVRSLGSLATAAATTGCDSQPRDDAFPPLLLLRTAFFLARARSLLLLSLPRLAPPPFFSFLPTNSCIHRCIRGLFTRYRRAHRSRDSLSITPPPHRRSSPDY